MTVPATARRAGPYSGNGVTTAFGFTFKVFSEADVRVVENTAGVETDAVLNSDYTVSLNGDQESSPGGTVTYSSAPVTGTSITLLSNLASSQPTDLPDGGAFRAQNVENALDRQAILTQQLEERVGRALAFPASDNGVSPQLPGATDRKGKVLAFDETTGEPVAGPRIDQLGTVANALTAVAIVAEDIANVNTAAANMASIIDAPNQAAAAEAARDAIDDRIYPGAYADLPTLRPDGSARQPGDRVVLTTGVEYIFLGGAWVDYRADAAASAAAALGSKNAAGTSEGNAADSALEAGGAKVAAEAARDAANTAGRVYASTAAGLAGTTNGQTFSVFTGDYIVQYRNDAGSATEVGRFYVKTYIDSMLRRPVVRDIVRFTDSGGKAAFRITHSGRVYALGRSILQELDAAGVLGQLLSSLENNRAGVRVRDSVGKSPFYITRTGRLRVWGRDILRELDLKAAQTDITPNKNLLIVGDSLSAYSGSWARSLTDVLNDPARVTTNLAVGGQSSSQQAGRLGALPFLLTFQNNTILSAGASTVTASQMLHPDGKTLYTCWPINDQGATWRARVAGIRGTFSTATFDGSGQPAPLVFTPDAGELASDLAVEVGVPTESVWAEGHDFDTLLIGIGRNNYADTDVVKRDWLAVKNWQRALNKRCILVTPPNMSAEGITSGPAAYAAFVELERYAQTHFGEFAVISRQILMRHGDGGSTDNAAIADGRVPPSLTSDGLHWTATGHGYIRAAAANILNRKGY